MAPIPPILSVAQDLALPELDKVLSQSTIPSSSDLKTLNTALATLAASAQDRADALRRDVDLLQQTYAALRARVRKEAANDVASGLASENNSRGVSLCATLPARHNDGDLPETHSSEQITSTPTVVDALAVGEEKRVVPDSVALPDRSVLSFDLATTSDPEEMKRRLGVAYYPTTDLSSLLPGSPSTEDYSKQKIPSQIAMTTFQASVEPLFRPFTEEDIGWLRDPGDRLAPFIIPPLGTHYTEVWSDFGEETPPPKPETTQKARESAEFLTDENMGSDAISCGPLTSRLLSALIKEDETTAVGDDAEQEKEKPAKLGAFKLDYSELEERINSELSFVGILDSSMVDWSQTSDDEISANIRALQAQLKSQTMLNSQRKRKLMDLVTDGMAKDEYTTILDDLDKQVEQAFLKRTRSIKAKKKRTANEKGMAISKVSIGSNIRALCDKRQKWITKIGAICLGDADHKLVNGASIFEGDEAPIKEKTSSSTKDDA